jgi:hypothetical protein
MSDQRVTFDNNPILTARQNEWSNLWEVAAYLGYPRRVTRASFIYEQI